MAGKYFEDLEVGMRFKHSAARTITEMDNVLFSSLTMNTQPLHVDAEFAANSEFGQRIVNGVLTLGLVVGLTVSDLSEGTIVANLSYDKVIYPNPTFHNDTIHAETEVLEVRESESRPNAGIVKFRHWGKKSDGTVVIEFERASLFLKRPVKTGR